MNCPITATKPSPIPTCTAIPCTNKLSNVLCTESATSMPSKPAATLRHIICTDVSRTTRQLCQNAAPHKIRYAIKPIDPVSAATFK